MEKPTMSVSPFHHRSDTKAPGQRFFRFLHLFSHLAAFAQSHVVPFPSHFALFYPPWYNNSYFSESCRTMGTIIGRTRKDGSKAYTAQIVIKRGGVIVHREAETFDRKQAANAWIVKREDELKRPGGLERKENPPLSAVIDRYVAESKNVVLGTKAQVLRTIRNS